ncbi:MAG: hypothetical protein NTV01_15650 [Bacteroidia bacterium]|nr:hypothetical protein [Bacteroidia bacterium]
MEIQHLNHQQIDKRRWDLLLHHAAGGTLYGQSWYLDAVCPGWQALVTSDYSRLMPLTSRQKFGLNYLYQPLLSQQLGVFSQMHLKPEEVDEFLSAIPRVFKLIEITLNDQNPPGALFPVHKHATYRLNLNIPYSQIQERYSENTRRNLKKATLENLRFRTNITLPEFLELLQKDKSAGANVLVLRKNRPALLRLVPALLNRNAGMICGVKNRHGDLLAAALIGQDKRFHYYLAPSMTDEGRESRAMFYLIDRYIHLHAGLPAILDFEGSDIESVARFYKGYGAVPYFYTSLRINRLPWPLNHLSNRRMK